MKKIVIITGLTASGKSSLAIKIAKAYNGEIVSADSVQVYRGLNIGSAKESTKTMKEIPHHLIDIKNFDEKYDVGQFVHDTEIAIKDIIGRGKLPIIVGGTGMYIKALIEGYSLGETTSNDKFREEMQTLALKQGNKFIWDKLYKLNPKKAKTVHPNNLKRVIRYLEIENFGTSKNNIIAQSILKNFNTCSIGIIADKELIYNKINCRVDEMMKAGLKKEILDLIKQGATGDMQAFNSIGYKEWFATNPNLKVDDFENLDTYKTVELIKQHTRNYCKRQLTFLKTIKNLKLLELNEAEKYIKEFLND